MSEITGTVGILSSVHINDIFKKYQGQLRNYILKRIPEKEDAEDILQNVFYQLLKMNAKENTIDQISGWLYSVTRNQIIDSQRKQKEVSLPYYSSDGEEEYMLADILDDSNSPEDSYLRSLVWEELETALAELPDEQRAIFELTEMQGISFKEISETTGIPVNTLLSRKRYAILHLRDRMHELYRDITNK